MKRESVYQGLLVPGHTWGHIAHLIDNAYLFAGDTFWFGADGGYSFINTLAEDNNFAYRSLGKAYSFYDGQMLGTTRPGRMMLRHVWRMTCEDAVEHSII